MQYSCQINLLTWLDLPSKVDAWTSAIAEFSANSGVATGVPLALSNVLHCRGRSCQAHFLFPSKMTAHPKIGSFPLTLSSNEILGIRHSCFTGGRGGLQNLVRQLTEWNYFRDILGARSWDGMGIGLADWAWTICLCLVLL